MSASVLNVTVASGRLRDPLGAGVVAAPANRGARYSRAAAANAMRSALADDLLQHWRCRVSKESSARWRVAVPFRAACRETLLMKRSLEREDDPR